MSCNYYLKYILCTSYAQNYTDRGRNDYGNLMKNSTVCAKTFHVSTPNETKYTLKIDYIQNGLRAVNRYGRIIGTYYYT